MKKFILAIMVLFITIGAFAQQIKGGSSLAWMEPGDTELTDTVSNGGDGYYSRIRIMDTGDVVFYFIEMTDNKITWAFTEIGKMENVKDTGNNTYSYTVNGNSYSQGFNVLDGGLSVMWIFAKGMASSGLSFIYTFE